MVHIIIYLIINILIIYKPKNQQNFEYNLEKVLLKNETLREDYANLKRK